MRGVVLVVVLAACGHVGFDARVGDGDADGGGASDSDSGSDSGSSVPGLVGWWKLDEGTGTVAADSSGTGNNGTLSGAATWVAGESGDAVAFAGDGMNAEVDVPDNVTLQLAGSWTVAAWVKLAALPAATTYDTVACKSTAGGFATYNLLVDNGHVSSGVGWMIAYNGNCGVANAKSPAPQLGAWTHVAGVFDASAMNVAIYVDGVAAAVVDETGCPPAHTGSGEDFTIGTEYGGGVTVLDGAADDVRVYDRALSAPEIQTIMAGG
ncbi:MAG TPA: LamG domain-containing protein [Kofleriaceae bacterium]|nr:LamG domain-containing protein [Kofleriaceae bacterium]